MTRAGAQALGLKLYASSPAAALTAICSPDGIDSGKIVKEFRESFDAVVANGQSEMKGQLFRIAHIGYYDYLDTIGILGALEHVLARVTGKNCRVRLRPYERPRKFMRAGYRTSAQLWKLEDREARGPHLSSTVKFIAAEVSASVAPVL